MMTEDERDYGALVASIIKPTPHTDGLAALRRMFHRWAHEEIKPGTDAAIQRQMAQDVARTAQNTDTMRRRGNP